MLLAFSELTCNFMNWSGPPSICSILPITKILSFGFEAPIMTYYYLAPYEPGTFFSDVPDFIYYLAIICEILYAYFISTIYLRRKEIASKYSRWKILILLFISLYFIWIVAFDMPKIMNSSYGFGSTTVFDSDGNGVTSSNFHTAFLYSLVWPIAPLLIQQLPGITLSPLESISILVYQIIPLILITLIICLIFFRKSIVNSRTKK